MKEKSNKISTRTAIVFALMLVLCFSVSFSIIMNLILVESLTMEKIIAERAAKIDDVLSKLFYRTQTLSSFILQNNGSTVGFESLAAIIVDDPAILNVLVAPDGVVSAVYPLEENEAVLGLDFYAAGAGNREAILAKESGQFVLGGPFNAIQGGQVLVGRLPVFMDGINDEEHFWGLVSVTLRYPDALYGAGLDELSTLGFDYELWRINPDNNERQIIACSGHEPNVHKTYVENTVSIANAQWHFRILSVRVWYEFPETWALAIISVALSILIATIAQNNFDLKTLKDRMELLSNTDALTGIHNRRYFMKAANPVMSRDERFKNQSFIIILDIDFFKIINDNYGHAAGDAVLVEIASRIAATLRSYDLFARYGGEEFIMLVSNIDEESASQLAERIRVSIADSSVKYERSLISVTASLGISQAAPSNSLENAINFADKALYAAKEGGRDKVVLYKETEERENNQ